MKAIDKFIDGLVDDWKDAWKWFSTQAIAFLTILAIWHETNEESFNSFFEIFPPEIRAVLLPICGPILIYFRLRSQATKDSDNEE